MDPPISLDEIASANLLRGMRKRDWVLPVAFGEDEVDPDAFMPDGRKQVSVNLDDAVGVGMRRLQQDRDRSEHGIARLPRPKLNQARSYHDRVPEFRYEGEGEPHDRHANLQYALDLQSRQYRWAATMLAAESRVVWRRTP